MSTLGTASVRQASRLCLKQTPASAGALRNSICRVATISNKISRRGYVSESKRDSAQVNVDTTIRADQKAFFKETGTLPEKHTIPGTSVDADAMMSPMAGKLMSANSGNSS